MREGLNALKLVGISVLQLVGIYEICRLMFFLFNYKYFAGIDASEFFKAFFWGIKFDLSALAYINLLFFFFTLLPFNLLHRKAYRTFLLVLLLLLNTIGILSNCVDFAYYPFILKRTSYDVFLTNGLSADFYNLLPEFIKGYWYVILLWLILTTALGYGFYKTINKNFEKENLSLKLVLFKLFSLIIISGLCILTGRGGLQLRPMTVVSAANYISPKYIPLTINTPFSIFTTYEQTSLTELDFMQDEQLKKYIYPVHFQKSKSENKLNVVVIVLESFSKEYIGYYNNGHGYTPFLDSLMNRSIVFTNAFANGKKSIEGIPAILAGMPSLMEVPYISTNYGSNEINTIAGVLKKKGYQTGFFHGGLNGTMGFDQFSKVAQYDFYFGQNEYGKGNDHDGHWGIWDEPFLQRFSDEMDKMKQPFHTCVFTLSSHHPFKVPEKYEDKFPKEEHPIFRSIRYADYSLQQFFKSAEKKEWFRNTLFVITADHTNDAFSPYYRTRTGLYAIPFILYQPGKTRHLEIKRITQQIDIMPTVFNYLKLNTNYYSLGNTALDTSKAGFAVNYIFGTTQLIAKDYALHFNGEKLLAMYDLKNDSMQNINLKDSALARREYLENLLKAILQTYHRDLIRNKTAF